MKKLLIILFIFANFRTHAQQKKLDSLLNVNANYKKEDSIKVIHLTNIFRQYTNLNDFNNVERYATQAITLAKKLPQTLFDKINSLSFNICGNVYFTGVYSGFVIIFLATAAS